MVMRQRASPWRSATGLTSALVRRSNTFPEACTPRLLRRNPGWRTQYPRLRQGGSLPFARALSTPWKRGRVLGSSEAAILLCHSRLCYDQQRTAPAGSSCTPSGSAVHRVADRPLSSAPAPIGSQGICHWYMKCIHRPQSPGRPIFYTSSHGFMVYGLGSWKARRRARDGRNHYFRIR